MHSDLNPQFSDRKTLEKYSSAFTLSDMEIFIFPELLYPLIMANIMSPLLWKWIDDPWFRDIGKRNFNSKANRIKQFIIQNYVFNLDLATWGLTSKTREIARFSSFFDIEMLKQSNALFGYEGDKYYFDIDIRKHFGLDKFNSDIIPYWKTETIEAMTAFRHKEGFSTGAGECVSLSALYASALFVVGKIPLEKIFLIATPLHSQNFIVEKEGLITNNRRIVTKNMWFNGTSLSEKARRALENEKVTIVAHISGYIHLLYNEATIDKGAYNLFTEKLNKFLKTRLSSHIFINFLRFKSRYKSLFQYRCECSGKYRYITLEKMFEYEHTSRYSVSLDTRASLVKEIEGDEFHLSPIHGKIFLNDIENILDKSERMSLEEIKYELLMSGGGIPEEIISEMFNDIRDFIITEPILPDSGKDYKESFSLDINPSDSREMILEKIRSSISGSELSLLSLYVYRDMDNIDWLPFVKAAIERNTICLADLNDKDTDRVYEILLHLPDESIYDSNRLALPDEVWNFKRGDGIEKALLLAVIIMQRDSSAIIEISINREKVILESAGAGFHFTSHKNFVKKIMISGTGISID